MITSSCLQHDFNIFRGFRIWCNDWLHHRRYQLVPHVVDIVSSSFPFCFLIVYNIITYINHTFNIWSVGIYSCRYNIVSLHFTNWLTLLYLLKFLPELQPKPSLRLLSRLQEVDLVSYYFLFLFSFSFWFNFIFSIYRT